MFLFFNKKIVDNNELTEYNLVNGDVRMSW